MRASRTCWRVGRMGCETGWFHPHSQYTQSKVHSLAVVGMRFIPRETPRRREWIGPYTIESNNILQKKIIYLYQTYTTPIQKLY